MAEIFLKADETANGVTFSSNFYGKGGTTTETAGITDAAVGSTFDQNIEVVTLDGNGGDYKYEQQGNQLLVYTLGDVLVATVTVQDDADGTQINFDNGTATAKLDGTQLELNGAAVAADPEVLDIPGLTGGSSGQTFTLTEDADQLTGQPNGLIGSKGTVSNAGDDLILAGTSVVGGVATNNLGSGDNVNGGAGDDELRIFSEGGASDVLMLPTLTDVEVVKAQNVSLGMDLTIALSNSTGYDQLWGYNTPAGVGDEVIFTDIRENAVIGAQGYTASAVVANFSLGALTSGVLSIASQNSATFFDITTVEAVDTLNVDATIDTKTNINGQDSDIIFGLSGGDQVGSTLNITGDADLFIREDDNEFEALDTVDVSSSGALDIDLEDNDNDITFTGGTGATTLITGNGNSSITTGAMADFITVGSGDNTIDSGDGNDIVNIFSGGDQTVDLGAGDDTVNTGLSLTIDDNLDGGDGDDTLAGNVYQLDSVSSDPLFDASIANFEILAIGGGLTGVAQGDNLVVDLANLDDISRVVVNTDVALGTAVAAQYEFELNATGDFGGRFSIEGVEIDIPENLDQNAVRDYVIANYEAAIIAAYNANHALDAGGPNVMTSIDIGDNSDGHIQFNFAQTSGTAPEPTYVDGGFALASGASFGAAVETVAGTTEVAEVQTLQVTGAPAATGFVTVDVDGTDVQTTLTAGQTVDQAAQTIRDAIVAASISGVASVTVVGDTITINYDAGFDPALVTFDPLLTGTTTATATTTAYVAPVEETQTVVVNNATTDPNGGFISITLGGDTHVMELAPNLSQDQIGVYIASQLSAIQADIPGIAGIGYNTGTDELTFDFTQAAGNAPAIVVADQGGNFPSAVDHTDTDSFGVDGDLDGTLLIDNIASGGTVTLASANGGSITVAPKVDTVNDVLNVELATAYTSVVGGEYTFDGIETLNFSTKQTSAFAQEVIDVDGADAETITVAGTVGISFTSSFANLTSFDASGITGSADATAKGVNVETTTSANASLTGGAGDDSLTGGSGDDTIDGGDGDDIIIGGLGAAADDIGDTLTGGAGADIFRFFDSLESNGINADLITDFDVTEDVIDVGFAVTYTGQAQDYGSVLTELDGTVGQGVYDTSTNSLYIDVDGDADLTDADYKIDFSSAITLSGSNFM